MKLFTCLGLLFLCLNISFAQNAHTLYGYDNYFDPDTLYMQVGDTVNFISVGYHSATEVDSVDWANNTATHNGGFYVGFGASTSETFFTIDTAGTYYNICVPHANMGMKSVIIVSEQALNVKNIEKEEIGMIYPNPAKHTLNIINSSFVRISDLKGREVLYRNNLNKAAAVIDISDLKTGVYFVAMENAIKKLVIK